MKQLNIILILLISFLNWQCQYEVIPDVYPPEADFAIPANVLVNESFTLTNNSKHGEQYSWDFGDGTSLSSELNPVHTYTSTGVKKITLTVSNYTGTNIQSKFISVNSLEPVADFSFSPSTRIGIRDQIVFTNQSKNALSSRWEMGDGRTFTTNSLTHSYSLSGEIKVKLTITGLGGRTDSKDITIFIDPFKNKMKQIPKGSFSMGCTPGDPSCTADERPTRNVTISNDFLMAETEVTQNEWQRIMKTTPFRFSNCTSCPAEMVSWDDAQQFISKLNALSGYTYRLPTEAEWEYAARSGSSTNFYAGSNTPTNVAFFASNALGYTRDVKGLRPNAWGLYDMSGNVNEWCSDRFGKYPSSNQTNPTGPSTGTDRVIRGGSWDLGKEGVRVSSRLNRSPLTRGYSIGFRLARSN
jgi:formylglycine-generating enzyme